MVKMLKGFSRDAFPSKGALKSRSIGKILGLTRPRQRPHRRLGRFFEMPERFLASSADSRSSERFFWDSWAILEAFVRPFRLFQRFFVFLGRLSRSPENLKASERFFGVFVNGYFLVSCSKDSLGFWRHSRHPRSILALWKDSFGILRRFLMDSFSPTGILGILGRTSLFGKILWRFFGDSWRILSALQGFLASSVELRSSERFFGDSLGILDGFFRPYRGSWHPRSNLVLREDSLGILEGFFRPYRDSWHPRSNLALREDSLGILRGFLRDSWWIRSACQAVAEILFAGRLFYGHFFFRETTKKTKMAAVNKSRRRPNGDPQIACVLIITFICILFHVCVCVCVSAVEPFLEAFFFSSSSFFRFGCSACAFRFFF